MFGKLAKLTWRFIPHLGTKNALILSMISFYGIIFECSSATSQVSITDPSLRFYNRCLNYAISNNIVEKQGDTIAYICGDSTAKSWFNYLGPKNQRQFSDRDGVSIQRWPDGRAESVFCFHKVEDASGDAISEYGCAIYAPSP